MTTEGNTLPATIDPAPLICLGLWPADGDEEYPGEPLDRAAWFLSQYPTAAAVYQENLPPPSRHTSTAASTLRGL